MKRKLLSSLAVVAGALSLSAELLSESVADDVRIDLARGARMVRASEPIVYDAAWGDGTNVTVSVNGATVVTNGAGVYAWETSGLPGATYVWRLATGDVTYEATFEKPRDLTAEMIDAIADQAYTGREIRPAVTVRDGDGRAFAAENYTLAYEDNVKPGVATVVVTGRNLCRGTARQTFRIVSPVYDALARAFEGAGSVDVDPASGTWRVTLTNDVTRTVTLPDAAGTVELDLNGHTLTGSTGAPGEAGGDAIRIAPDETVTGGAIRLVILDSLPQGGDAIVGGSGGVAVIGGAGGGKGGSGIAVDGSTTQTGIVIVIREGVGVRGGGGGAAETDDQATGEGGEGVSSGEAGSVEVEGRVRNVYAVTFDGGEHGTVDAAKAVQYVAHGEGAVAPQVAVDEGWLFDGWDSPFDTVVTSLVVTATYRTDVIPLDVALGTTNLAWTTAGDGLWEGHLTAKARDGQSAARSGVTPDGGTSVLAVTLDGAGTLTFDWRASCETRYDAVRLEVDGQIVGQLSGDSGWTNETVAVGNGAHTVRWIYRKNRSGSALEDAVWLDNVVWTPAPAPTLGEALNAELAWTTGGNVPWEAYRTPSAYAGGVCAVSGAIGDCETSTLETTVTGAGRLAFVWAVSCESDYDWYEFSVDGKVVRALSGEADWTAESVVLGEGAHTLRWEYWKDEMDEEESVGADCAFLDDVRWTPAGSETERELATEELAAFCAWLKEHRQLDADGAPAEARALQSLAVSRKGTTLLDEFIAGTDPEDEEDVFSAQIEMVGGKPEVRWKPALNGAGVKEGVRTYRVEGTRALGAGWETVTEGNEADYRFFRVTVDLP